MNAYEPIAVPASATGAMPEGFSTSEGGVCAAQGVKASGVHAGFRKNPERLDLAVVVADKTATCAATFTQNQFCAAPVQLDRKRAATGKIRAVMLNSGIANAATGELGLAHAEESAHMLAEALGCEDSEVEVASTGVIGPQLEMGPFESGIPEAVSKLAATAEGAHDAAMAVMTTDTHPKEAALQGTLPSGTKIHLGGFVKGSGMIQPNMATMLSVMATDANVSQKAAHAALLAAVQGSYNKVTVDSDTSTNDSCFLMATGAAGGPEIQEGSADFAVFAAALKELCQELARQIAADGEGSTKLITVDCVGARTDTEAETVARAIANSPLVKCAVFGNDANWGRVAAAAGKCGVPFDQTKVDIDFLGVAVCRKGQPVPVDEDDMLVRFKADEVTIAIDLGQGSAHCRIWTCDLTHDYVSINGDYRS